MDSDVSEEPAASTHAYVRSSDLTDFFAASTCCDWYDDC